MSKRWLGLSLALLRGAPLDAFGVSLCSRCFVSDPPCPDAPGPLPLADPFTPGLERSAAPAHLGRRGIGYAARSYGGNSAGAVTSELLLS